MAMREIAAALVVLAISRSTAAQSTTGANPATPQAQNGVVRLEDQLVVGLRATRSDQRTFLRKVAELVEKGTFDRMRVTAIFDWARNKNAQYPFPYFERAMRFDSNAAKITLPEVQLVQQPFNRAS